MANLIPFRGVLYNPAAVGNIAKVVAPPYDVIDGAYQRALHARHPHNIIRLELGCDEAQDSPTNNRYSRAANWLCDWMQHGILHRDPAPALYLYMIDYHPRGARSGEHRTLTGFLSTVELEDFGTGRIFPHENTRSAAKADRLHLLTACRANFSPIFSLYSDPERRVLQLLETSVDLSAPAIACRDDSGFQHRLWSISDPRVLQQATSLMRPKPLFIADGHHRYETSLKYRDLRRAQEPSQQPGLRPYDAVLMLFAALEDPGLTVLPTHRVLTNPLPDFGTIRTRLQDAFTVHEIPIRDGHEHAADRAFIQQLRTVGASKVVFGLAIQAAPAYLLLELRREQYPPATASERDKLDVSILQHRVVAALCPGPAEQEAILYTKDDEEALDLVRKGTAQAALLLNPTRVSEVRAVAASGGRMPHKSTYFFPKPLTGLVLNVMEEAG